MTKREFLLRWAKKASQGGAAEAFERDVETLIHTAIRIGASVITNGLIEGSKKLSRPDREFIIRLASESTKAVDRGIRKLYD